MNRTKYLYNVTDVMEILECSKDHAYKIIKKLNSELIEMGYEVETGKVPSAFFAKKYYGLEPLYKAIDEMMYGHSFKLNDNDRKILQRAINSSVDEVTEEYSIGKRIEENVRDNMPSISLIEKEVQEQIQRRPRMHR